MKITRWPTGGLNLDDSPELMDPNDWSYAANIVAGRSYQSKNGEKEDIRGTSAIVSAVDLTGCQHIGTIRSAEDDVSYLFYYHATPANQCIVKFDAGVVSLVLRWDGLNFSNLKQFRINGGGVIGDLLYFTDDKNQPRCVHTTRYADGSTPSGEEEILHIKRGPIFALEIDEASFVGGNEEPLDDVQFSYQYEYTDGQLSVIAPWTKLYRGYGMAGVADALSEVSMRVASNEVVPTLVRRIKLIARKGNNGAAFYWMTLGSPFEQTLYSYTYNQHSMYGGIVPSIYLKQFDLVPLTAKASCITKSRAWFANFLEGYDLIDTGRSDEWTTSAIPLLSFSIEDTAITTEGPTFSPNSRYRLGVVFHDDQGRSSGVYSRDSWVLTLPMYVDDFDVNRFRLKYRIADNAGPGGPFLPDWIKYYSLVITKDLNKSYYLQSGAGVAASVGEFYVAVANDGTETYSPTFDATQQYMRLHMGRANINGIYYSFKEGDMAIVTNTTGSVTSPPMRVRYVDGPWVYVDIQDMGNVGAAFDYGFQIFTPNKVDDQLFYEIARREVTMKSDGLGFDYATLDDAAADFFYDGDSILKVLQGTGYRMAQMRLKPNNGNWDLDYGKPYVKTDIGQVHKKTFIRYSSPYIAGTNVNGLSEFNIGDEDSAPVEAIEIQKLQPTSRDSTGGEVILTICDSDSYSIYVDEARMSTNDGQSLVINSLKVIGDIRKQASAFGTLHPESIFEEGGQVFGWDHYARTLWRYSSNGMFPISEYKAVSHFERQAELNDVDDVVVCGYDPFYKMAVVTFKNADTSTKKTIGFCEPLNRWVSFYDFAPDGYIIGSNKMFSAMNDSLYSHDNVAAFNNFYGVDYDSKIRIPLNDAPNEPKEWKVMQMNLSNNFFAWVGGNQTIADLALRVDITNRYGQATSILYNEFEVDENIIYGEIRGDENSPGGVLDGDPIYSNTTQVEITFSGGTYKQFLYLEAGVQPSRGHET